MYFYLYYVLYYESGRHSGWLLEFNGTGVYFILWVICEISETGIQEFFSAHSFTIMIYHFFWGKCLLRPMNDWVQERLWTREVPARTGSQLSFLKAKWVSVFCCQETQVSTKGGWILGRAWFTCNSGGLLSLGRIFRGRLMLDTYMILDPKRLEEARWTSQILLFLKLGQ